MTEENTKPWENYTPPGGQIRIEGTDELPLVTDQPVEIVPRIKKPEPQTEALFQVESADATVGPKATPRSAKPYKARYSDTTDASVRALRSGLEDEPPVASNPDADIDEVFGADSARRIL